MKLMFKFKRYLKSCKLDFSYGRELQEILTVNAKNQGKELEETPASIWDKM